jgi:transposase
MSMGTRKRRQRQEPLWVMHTELAAGPGHPFYEKLRGLLDVEKFDEFVEKECAHFYAEQNGRPSLPPGVYFRALLIGYFEGIDSERRIAWRMADSLGLRKFLQIGLDESTPNHSTISRTRRLIDLETYRKVFGWVRGLLADRGLLKGKIIGIDATTLEANAAMRSIVRRDNGQSYEKFLTELAKQSGVETPTREDLARIDRKRKKKGSNEEWVSSTDADARISRMKDGSRHMAYQAEHAVDMETGSGGGYPARGGPGRPDDDPRDSGGGWRGGGGVDRPRGGPEAGSETAGLCQRNQRSSGQQGISQRCVGNGRGTERSADLHT